MNSCPIPKVNATSTKRSTSRKRKSIVLTNTPMKLELEQAKEKREMAKKLKQEKLVRKQENSKQNKVKVITEKTQYN